LKDIDSVREKKVVMAVENVVVGTVVAKNVVDRRKRT
jgi:hypothetical protein